MKENIVKVETIEELAIRLPEDFAEAGEKVSVEVRDDGSMVVSKLIPIEVSLSNDVLLNLTIMAHEQDITLNELCCNILREIVETDDECLGFEEYKPYYQDGVCTGCYNAPERCACDEPTEHEQYEQYYYVVHYKWQEGAELFFNRLMIEGFRIKDKDDLEQIEERLLRILSNTGMEEENLSTVQITGITQL